MMTVISTAPVQAYSRNSQAHVWRTAWCVAAISTILCVLLADRNGLWLDEYYTLISVRLPWREMVKERLGSGHSPLPFFYAALFHSMGDSERILRLGSALAIGGAALGVTKLALSLDLQRYLWPVWILCILNPFWLAIGTQFRYMALLVCLSSFVLSGAVIFSKSQSTKNFVSLLCSMTLLLWTHASAQFVAVGVCVFLLSEWWAGRNHSKRTLLTFLSPVLLAILFSVPLLLLVAEDHEIPTNRLFVRASTEYAHVIETFFGNETLWPRVLQRNGIMPEVRYENALLGIETMLILLATALVWSEVKGWHSRAVRLVLTVSGGIILSQLIVKLLNSNARVSSSYLAALSIPLCIFLGIAWNARVSLRWRYLYRGLLAVIILLQTTGTMLDKGRMHRETVEWIIDNHSGDEAIVASADNVNTLAFSRAGFDLVEEMITIPRLFEKTRASEVIEKGCEDKSKGFVLLYASRVPILDVVRNLNRDRFFLEYKYWRITAEVQLMAWIRDWDELEWLESLEPPVCNLPATGND